MASPFALFRKNQKILMAVFGIMAMIAFVFLDSLGSNNAPPDSAESQVVAETKDLKLTGRDIGFAVRNRSTVQQFLGKALAAGAVRRQDLQIQATSKGTDPAELQQLRESSANLIEGRCISIVTSMIGTTDERSIVNTLVLADLAKRSGVQISDQRVMQFIEEFVNRIIAEEPTAGLEPPTPSQLDQIAAEVRRTTGLSQRGLYDAFRTELLAGSLREAFATQPAVAESDSRREQILATPIDRWDYYTRKNLQATVDVVAVRTSDYVDAGKVPAPSERQLMDFFDKYKFDEPALGSPEPGFKIPQQAAFQYFAADEANFQEPDKVTAAEIADHYEKNKARYPYTAEDFSLPAKPEATDTPPASTPSTTPTTTPNTSTPPSATPTSTAPAAKPTATPTASPSATATPAATTAKPTPSATPAPAASPSASAPAATATSTAAPKATASASAAAPSSGSCEPEDGISDDCQAPAATATASPTATKPTPSASPSATTSTPAATSAPAATATKPAPSASATPSATASATAVAKPAATPTSSTAVVAAPAPSASPSGTAAAVPTAVLPPAELPTDDVMLPDDVRSGRKPQYDPLWRVEGKIRKELAEAAGRKRITETFAALRKTMSDKEAGRPIDVASDDKQPPLFTAEQWSDLAKPYPGVVAKTTEVLSSLQVVAEAKNPGLFHSTINGFPFAAYVFSSRGTYFPTESKEIPEANSIEAILKGRKTVHYLFWKTTDVAARVPEFKEYRGQVELAWKNRAAREMAEKDAAEMAKKAAESSKPLVELFPQAKRTNQFSWFKPDLSGGFNGRQRATELSEVDNVEDAGPEFMEAVFSLTDGEVATAFNNPKTVCYVIRAVTVTPPRSQLYELFTIDQFDQYEQFGTQDVRRLIRDAEESLIAQSGLKWLREPREADRN